LLLLISAACAVAQTPVASAVPDTVTVDDKTESVIRGALKFLASKQLPSGAWGSSGDEQKHPAAITGYVLMAFLAAGHLPGEGEWGRNVTAGMQYLLDQVQSDGIIGRRDDGQYMYGHGVAAIALAEIYGQTKSPAMRPRLERVIRVILGSQNDKGGWRYMPVADQDDISVTVLQVVALRAAKNAGLDVPQSTIDRAVQYVRSCAHEKSGGFTYQPGGGKGPGFARTAAAIYSLQVCGRYDDPLVRRGSEYLFSRYHDDREWYTYGNFYAAPAQYMIGGATWQKWYTMVKEELLADVVQNGGFFYWENNPDKGRSWVGPVYCTTVYTMILAMPYHYIPLYQR